MALNFTQIESRDEEIRAKNERNSELENEVREFKIREVESSVKSQEAIAESTTKLQAMHERLEQMEKTNEENSQKIQEKSPSNHEIREENWTKRHRNSDER